MEEKRALDYIGQMFSTYGIIVTIFIFIGITVGDKAGEFSTLYVYEGDGFSCATLLQLLALSAIITVSQVLFLTDRIIKDMKMIVRIIAFIGVIVAAITVFAIAFKWFPINDSKAWLGFAVYFSICTAISIAVSRIKEASENKKMEQALNKLNRE